MSEALELTLQTLSAAIAKKSAYEIIEKYGKVEKEDKNLQVIYSLIDNYYSRDPSADSVDPAILLGMISNEIRNPKAAEKIAQIVNDALSASSTQSIENLESLILQSRIGLVKDKLAVALANRNKKDEETLFEELSTLKEIKNLEELDNLGMEEYPIDTVESLITKAFNVENLMKIWPLSLAKKIGGGLQPGNHVVIFARPNMGKSAMVVTIGSSLARTGWKVLVVGNEEPAAQYWMRFIQALAGRTKGEVLEAFHENKQLATQRGLGNITIVTAAPGTKSQIEGLIEKYKPNCLVIDQLRNIDVGRSESRTNQLEAAANFARNMAIKHHIVTISVTQAGDSAEGKSILEMGDVDYSNTGIPATADLMIGIGATKEQIDQGIRVISLSKNKLTAEHENWPVRLNIPLSRYQDL